jgi:hypothetical protein
LDLCYGRWDTNQHSIADAHPGNVDRIVFPGQDFNNARMMGKKPLPNFYKTLPNLARPSLFPLWHQSRVYTQAC